MVASCRTKDRAPNGRPRPNRPAVGSVTTPDRYEVGEPEPLVLTAGPALSAMFVLSPFVWREGPRWRLAVRAVPHSERPEEKVSRVHLGTSEDGLHFRMDDEPVLPPGPDPDDRDGCEDPTVVGHDMGCAVFYSGWNQEAEEGRLLWAWSRGDVADVDKRGRVLPEPNRYINTKETALIRAADGSWRMFFEYADGRSLIGVAEAPSLDGPWAPQTDPFGTRENSWDSWHLSPGPIIKAGTDAPVLFYNGADRETRWRIGWVQLSPDCRSIAARGAEPTVLPHGITGDDTDIAFAASAVEDDGGLWLYYSVSDKNLFRVRLDER